RLLARRKERADVAEAGRAEDGVGERVGDHVAVRVSRETAGMVEADAAEHERHAVLERVRIDAGADPQAGHPSGSCRPSRPSNTVTVSHPASRASASAWSKSRPTSSGTCASAAVVTPTP